jgi:acrylyl-CoA reductase (NADPH)
MDLPGSVAPFILRNVALLGVDSVMAPRELRLEAWGRLARELDHEKLAAMTSTVPLEGILEAGQEIVAGRIKGRVVVEVGGS